MAPSFVSTLVAVGTLLLATAIAQSCSYPQGRFQAVMAAGYQSQLIINNLKAPRDMVFDLEGNLLVAEQGGAGIRQIKLTDSGGKVCVVSSKTIIPDAALNHGIDISADGKTLFVSSSTTVFAYDYNAASGSATNKKTIITGMQQGGLHQTRSLLVPKNDPSKLLVSRGSDGNIDAPTAEIGSGRSQIRVFEIGKIMSSSVAYTNGQVLGWGLRNSVGVGEDPTTGGIWSVENSVDDMKRGNQDVHNDNPAEELNYHGVITDANNGLFGKNYGYPYCFAAWDPSKLPSNTGISVGTQFIMDGVAAGVTDNTCRSERVAPRLVFPSHTAPLDIKFKKDGSAAFVAFHGSWDRQPPDGYRVGKIKFQDGQPVADSTSTTAVEYIMANQNVQVCPNSCFRPAGLAFDSKGRLFMSSDQSGEIYVIYGV